MASLSKEDRPQKPWKVRWRERGVQRTRRFATKREAEKFIGDLARGVQPTDASRITLTEWFAYWLTHHGQAWAPRTVKDRKDYAKRLILPHLGHLRLSEITRRDVREWQRTIVLAGHTTYTVNRVGQVLRAAINSAVAEDLIPQSPIPTVRFHLPRDVVRRKAAEIVEVEAVRAQMRDPSYRLIVSLMAYAGLRPSEARAITWGDIGESAIRVHATKTGTVRFVPILAPVRDDIARTLNLDSVPADIAGEFSEPDPVRAESVEVKPGSLAAQPSRGLIVSSNIDPHNWRHRVWDPARRAAGVSITAYACRHLYGSLLVQAGHSLIQVAQWMGHSDLAMLSQVYGHVLAEYETRQRGLDVEAEVMKARHDASRI